MFNFPSPAAAEQKTLAAIEANKQQISNYILTFPNGTTAAVMAQWIGQFDQHLQGLQAFAPQANWLQSCGLPQASQRLHTLMQDFNNTRNIYVGIQQSVVQTQNGNNAIWQDANAFATNNILAATRHSNYVFGRSMQGFFDVWENRCYDCHRSINVTAGGYCLDCARRRRGYYY